MTTVGEPIEPEVWRWYHYRGRQGRGGHRRHLVADRDRRLPRQLAARAEADEAGQLRPGGDRHLPGHLRRGRQRGARGQRQGRATSASATPGRGSCETIWGQPERFLEVYYASTTRTRTARTGTTGPTSPMTARSRRPTGTSRILGRVDDVINVAGHRLGTKEIESAALTVPEVAEAAAVPVVDDIRGRVGGDVRLAQARLRGQATRWQARSARRSRSRSARSRRPKHVWIVPDMPKTRSGKIMRRVIAVRVQLRRRRGCHHPGQPGGRRRYPPPRTEREGQLRARSRGSSPRRSTRRSKSFGAE